MYSSSLIIYRGIDLSKLSVFFDVLHLLESIAVLFLNDSCNEIMKYVVTITLSTGEGLLGIDFAGNGLEKSVVSEIIYEGNLIYIEYLRSTLKRD